MTRQENPGESMTTVVEKLPTTSNPPTETNISTSSSSSSSSNDVSKFATTFIHDWTTASDRVERGRRLTEQLQSFLKERASLEESYATNLKRLASRLILPPSECRGVATAVNALKTEAMRRAEQSKELSESINNDIIGSTLSLTIKNHASVLNQIIQDGTIISKNLEMALLEVRKTEANLAQLGREVLFHYANQPTMERAISTQQTRAAAKTLQQILELERTEQRYTREVHVANETKRLYSHQMEIILKSLEDMDRKRLACFKDALRKFMVFETSCLRNIQYDLDITINAVEDLNEQQEISEFIEKNKMTLSIDQPFKQDAEEEKKVLESNDGKQLASFKNDRSVQESSDIIQPRHWSILSISTPENVPTATTFSDDFNPGQQFSATVESAGLAARKILKNTPLDKMAHISSIVSANSRIIDKNSTTTGATVTPNIKSTLNHSSNTLADTDALLTALLSNEKQDQQKTKFLDPAEEKRVTAEDSAIKKIESVYNEFLELLWNFDLHMSDNLCERVDSIREELSSSLHRFIMIHSLKKFCNDGRNRLPNMDALRILGLLAEQMLDFADRQWDVVAGRALVVLSQKFYAEGYPSDDPQSKGSAWIWPHLRDVPSDNSSNDLDKTTVQWFLHRVIYHSVLWNRVHFWQEALEFTISLHYQKFMFHTAATSVKQALRQESLLSGSDEEPPPCTETKEDIRDDELLDNFGACMLAFGIVEPHVTSLIQRVCASNSIPTHIVVQLLRCLPPDTAPSAPIMLPLAPFPAPAHPSSQKPQNESTTDVQPVTAPDALVGSDAAAGCSSVQSYETPPTLFNNTVEDNLGNAQCAIDENSDDVLGKHAVFDD